LTKSHLITLQSQVGDFTSKNRKKNFNKVKNPPLPI